MKKITFILLLLPFLNLSQVQIGQDINGVDDFDESGTDLSLSGDGTIVAIGSYKGGNPSVNAGHVRVFKNINNIWTQIGQNINGSNANDFFGLKVSLSSDGDILAAAAKRNNSNGSSSGQVKVYQNQNDNWVQLGQNLEGDNSSDMFGNYIDVSANGNRIAIGTGTSNVSNNYVRVYELLSGIWTQVGQDINDVGLFDYYGQDISISSNGNIIAIQEGGLNTNPASVKIFEEISGVWTQVGQDIESISDLSLNILTLSEDGNVIAISYIDTSVNNDDSRLVKVFERISDIWTQIGNDINGENPDDESGFSLSLSSNGSLVAIGSVWNDDNGENAGHVRIFKNINNNWIQVGNDIDGESNTNGSGFSVDLNLSGSIVAIGAPYNSDNGSFSGHVRIFSIASELALLEVVEDILGNINGINVSADQLNSINGVSGAIDGVNYTTALDNGTFVDENNPTVAEIQAIIDQINAALSLNENDLFSFKLYPNPTKNQFTIQLDPSVQLQNVVIYNILGQVVLTSEEKNINTSKLSSGSYVVEILTNKGKSSKQLIIE